MRRCLSWLALPALAVATACSSGAEQPHVVLVVIDTARQDRFSCYGYERQTTPNVDRLAREGTRFAEAYSVSSWTAPAHASLFTGRLPSVHGCTQQDWRLDERLPTLAELFGAAGYHTVGIVENAVLSRAQGFGRGFERYHEAWRQRFKVGDQSPAAASFRQRLRERDPDEPQFFFLNLIAPHNPYDSSRQFLHEYVADSSSDLYAHSPPRFYLGQVSYTEDELARLNDLYDAEIRYADHVVGELTEELERAGMLDDTVFVVTSDHGENIGDHGHLDHYFTLYETTIRVPLVVRYPRAFGAGLVDANPAQLIDLFPTLMALAGIAPRDAEGIDLCAPGQRDGRALVTEYYRPRQALLTFGAAQDSPRLEPWKRHLRAVVHGDRKLIWSEDGQHELYDLGADPDEVRDLASEVESAADLRALTVLMEALLGDTASGPQANDLPPPSLGDLEGLDEETLEALRRLGYIGDE